MCSVAIDWTASAQLDCLDLTDNLAILSRTHQQIQVKIGSVAAASSTVGLKAHNGKCNILKYNTGIINLITHDGEFLEVMETFTYLGSIIDKERGYDINVNVRIDKIGAASQ